MWISRGTYEELVRRADAADRRAAVALSDAQALRDQYVQLLDRYQGLMQGGGVHPPKGANTLQEMIRDQAGGDQRLSAYLSSYAARLKRQGLSEDEVVAELTQWTTTEALSS